jgi:hypothetical protein
MVSLVTLGRNFKTDSKYLKMDRRFLRLSVFQQNLTRVHQTLIEQSSSVATAGSLMCNRASTLGARVILSKQERKREHNNRRYLTAATYGRKQEQPLKFVPGNAASRCGDCPDTACSAASMLPVSISARKASWRWWMIVSDRSAKSSGKPSGRSLKSE